MDQQTKQQFKEYMKRFLGYPCNHGYDFSEIVDTFKFPLNNVGCPFSSSTYHLNTKSTEIDVLKFFAHLWGIDFEKIWGYITSAGTEGNLQGLYVGREHLGKECVFLTSKDSHYSIFKIAKLLCLDTKVIDTHENGEMNYDHFESTLSQTGERPVLINANLGTTMKGAIDNTREIYRILKKHNKHHNYYLHVDGALMGFVLPFLEIDLLFKAYAHSISISGHKFLGCPFPCGVFMMEKRLLEKISQNIEYIGSNDCMISGSRNGHSPLFLKHIIDKRGYSGFKKDVEYSIDLAEYLVDKLPNAWRNQNSLTVVFPKVSAKLIHKWQLASDGNISHVVCLPHVTKEQLDEFIKDVLEECGI